MAEVLLEDRLVALGETMRFPRAEALVADVLAELEHVPTQRASPRRRRALFVAAAAVLLTVVAVAAIPDSRRAIARWLGFDSLRIERVVRLPPTSSRRQDATMTLHEAAAAVGIEPLVATVLGEPVAVEAPAGRYVVVHYDGVLVATLPGRLDRPAFGKFLTAGTTVEGVTVDGRAGYWISGAPHVFAYFDRDGEHGEILPAADTLVWQRGDVIVRVEGDIALERALEIAASVGEP